MNVYEVVLKEVHTYKIQVHANDEESAIQQAYDDPMFIDSYADDIETSTDEVTLLEEDVFNEEEEIEE